MIIFTDGSTINNGKKDAIGGIGVYIPQQDDIQEYKISYSLQTNNKFKITNQISELIATILGIEKAITLTSEEIYIYTDSKYVIDCATTWCKNWIANNWKKANGKAVDNLWLIYRLIQLTTKYPIIFKHVRAHTDEPENKETEEYLKWYGNDIVDKLAQSASSSLFNLTNEINTLNWASFAGFLLKGMNKDKNLNLPYDESIEDFFRKNLNLILEI